jgi:transcriptional regulator with XRE-family HTH domain
LNTFQSSLKNWREENPLRKWRAQNNFSQADVAAAVGAGYHSVYDWEIGKVNPNDNQFELLSGLTKLKTFKRTWLAWAARRPQLGGKSGNQ